MLIIALLIAIVWTIIAWRNWPLAVSLLIGLLPTYLLRFKIGPLPMTVLEELILLTTAIWLIKQYPQPWANLRSRAKNWRAYPLTIEIIIVLLVAWLALVIGGNTTSGLGLWKAYFIEPILVFILFWNVPRGTKNIERGYLFLAGSLLLVSLVAGYQYLTGDLIANLFWADEATRRATSVFGYPNAVGLFAGPVSLALLGFLVYRLKQIKKWFNWVNLLLAASIILGWLAIFWAQSEGAMIGLLVALVVLGLIASRWSRLVVLVAVIIVGVMIWQRSDYLDTIKQKVQLADLSGQIRQSQWQETWQMLGDGRWLNGAGLANYQAMVEPYHHEGIWIKSADKKAKPSWQPLEIYLYPHNVFLNFWSELGLVGLIIFAWLWLKVTIINFLNFWRYHRHNKLVWLSWGLFGAWLATLVHGLVDVPYFKNDLAVLFWLGLAMTFWLKWQLMDNKQNDQSTID